MEKKLDSNYKIPGLNDTSIIDYWEWAYSDILSNRNRGIFAEFLVGHALGIITKPRVEWDCVDFDYGGKKIEVKSSAYLQTWDHQKPNQNKLSTIKYDIKKRKYVDIASEYVPDNNGKPVRFAHCYVFCLYTEKDRKKANIKDISSWEFYVVSTSIINKRFNDQESISLSILQDISKSVPYLKLKARIDFVLSSIKI